MILAPRYDGPTILSIAGSADDQRDPFCRQRRRMIAMLTDLADDQWAARSRCDEWSVRDVVAHLVDVNKFWHTSIEAGLAGTPTRVLASFDPAATPSMLVDWMSALSAEEVFEQFVTSSDALLADVERLTDEQWTMAAESPVGHVSIRLLVQHALWDCWVHERDIATPLGIATAAQPDELESCLRYAAAASPALGMGVGRSSPTVLAVEATDPAIRFVLRVDDSVAISDEPANDLPCLRGEALELVEALSLRAPMPSSTPAEWSHLLGGLATAFDAAGELSGPNS
jgi:uncharacterized protein (TIGR03083 family)